MLRYDVVTKQFETVFDVTAQFGADRNVWQMHSSNDDLVHSATLQVTSTGQYLGCLVYSEVTAQFRYYPKIGIFDECNSDKSGRWTISLKDVNRNVAAVNHISHTNSKPNVPSTQQFACGSNADTYYSVQNEIICFRIDSSDDQLIVALVMTGLNASGGCCDVYAKYPEGNLDITGRYLIWTTI